MKMKFVEIASHAAGGKLWRRAAVLGVVCCAALAWGQEPAAPLPPAAQLQAAKDAVSANQAVPEAERAAAAAAYDEALRLAQVANDLRAAEAEVAKQRDSAPETEKQLRAEIDKLKAAVPAEIKKEAALADVDPLLTTANADYKAAQAEFDAALAEPDARAEKRRAAPAAQEAARKREAEALAALNAPAAAGESAELTAAKRLAAQAGLEAARAELKLIETELGAFDTLNNLVGARQEVAKARLSKNERDLKVLQEAASRLRREEATAAARKAAEDLLQIPDCDPEVRQLVVQLATDNEALALERAGDEGLAKRIEDATNDAQEATAKLAAVREQWNNVKKRVSAGGFSETVGVILRKQRAELPNTRKLEMAIQEREASSANIELMQGEKRQQRLALGDLNKDVEDKIATTMSALSQYEKQRIQGTVRKLVSDQRDLIDAVTADYSTYLAQLEDANLAQKELVKVTREFSDYISENVLWIRGRPPISARTLEDVTAAARWLFDPGVWADAPRRLFQDAFMEPVGAVAESMAVLFLIGLRRLLRKRLSDVGEDARGRRETHFSHTVYALILSLLISMAWPGALWLVGMRLSSAADGVNQLNAVATGLFAGAWVLWSIEFVRILFVRNGLADAHFTWALAREGTALRRALALGALVGVPAVVINTALIDYGEDTYSRSLGCVAYLVVLATLAVGAARAATLCKRAIHADDPEHWFVEARLRGRVARWGVPVLQVGLAVMVLIGYYYTSLEIGMRAHRSVLIIIAAAVLSGVVRRWLLLARRRIAIEQARRKREAMRAEAEGEKTEAARDEHEMDILKIDAQSQAAIRIVSVCSVVVALWFVWTDVLPALNVLQGIPLWNTVGQVEVQTVAENGTVTRKMEERIQTITAANLGLSLAAIVLTVLAVRNLPGLIELLLIQRLKMPRGERYAALAVIRYALTGLGVVLAFQGIGVGWSKVQWLIAALGVGLGFGLQEIFANFISGLILLFERPVRVGDVVTVGDNSGTISQIRIRATTITNFDNKEFIVPNKEFVTGKILNWSLPTPGIRIVVPVGIAYGSDTEKAARILLQIALNHPKVSDEPAPQAVFTQFGEKALIFELRCHSADIDSAGPIRHELMTAVHKQFFAAGIEMMMPPKEPAKPTPGPGAGI